MNFGTVQDYQLQRVARKIQLANLKRKIRDGEVPPEQILKRYRLQYPNVRVNLEGVEWQRHPKEDVYTLYDKDALQPRFIVTDRNKPLFVPPPGCRVRRYSYEDDIWTPESTPVLTPDALKCIFRHLQGWEIMTCRLVSKLWCRVATNEVALWRLARPPPRCLKFGAMTPFRRYVQNMFINASDEAVIRFFFARPAFFVYVCQLLLGSKKRLRVVRESNNRLRVDRFTAVRREGILLCDGVRRVSVQLFLDAHRQQLLLRDG